MPKTMNDLTAEERAIIEEHRRKAKYAEADAWQPMEAEDYDVPDKVFRFDKLHEMALRHFKEVKASHNCSSSSKQWFFEAVMELLGEDVWKAYNEYLD